MKQIYNYLRNKNWKKIIKTNSIFQSGIKEPRLK